MFEFNKILKSERGGRKANAPAIRFRKLKPYNGNVRLQAVLNKSAMDLAKEINPLYDSFQIMYSDEHLIIGLQPLGKGSIHTNAVGCTGIKDLFEIKIGKNYKIKSNANHIYFDTAQKDFDND